MRPRLVLLLLRGPWLLLLLARSRAMPDSVSSANVYLGPWSPCQGAEGRPGAGAGLTTEPRLGEQRRSVACRGPGGQDAPMDACAAARPSNSSPPLARACVLAEDCRLSAWSAWRTPARFADALQLARRGRAPAVRVRGVLRLPQGAGRPCGPLLESNAAFRGQQADWANVLRWAAGPWGPCRAGEGYGAGEAACGGGLQRRELACEDRLRRVAHPELACRLLPPPPALQRCEVPCPRDCVVGQWGPWGPCTPLASCPLTPIAAVTATGYRKRSRRVLVASSTGGAPCPALDEVQPCASPACQSWAPGPWGPCRLASPSRCGPGRRQRRLACKDLQGSGLAEVSCAGVAPRPAGSEECRVACPRDCVLGPWGPWGPCSRACSSRHHRAHRHRNRTVIAPAGEGGSPCQGELQQVEECEPQGCQGYSWLPLPWQPCAPPAEGDAGGEDSEGESPAAEEPCGGSLQQAREVWCMENSDRRVADVHCSPLRKPETQRTCEKRCLEPCKLSPWTQWTPCPTDSEDGFQERERFLEAGWEQAESCGALRERRSCPGPPEPAQRGHWAHGAWSACQLPAGLDCGEGIMTRGIWCSLQHHKVPPGSCRGTPPASALRCSVDCTNHCQLSAWSPWSPCTEPCAGVTTRYRQKLGDAPCPNTVLYEGHECPCRGFRAQLVGSWSTCLAGVRGGSQVCGPGLRYRRLLCLDSAGRPVEPHWCRHHLPALVDSGPLAGLLSEECSVACEVDCRVSAWSSWSSCELGDGGAACGVGLQHRTRNILVNATKRGRACGETHQVKVCSKPCEHFGWRAGGWSECQLIPHHRARGCGTGDQSRSVRCTELASGAVVADALCDAVDQPADLNACHTPCPGECVLSSWSDWSQCPAACAGRAQRDRTRALLRAPAPGHECPPLVQAQPCVLNQTCFHYAWRVTTWGACLPLGGSSCGEGMQQRAIFCQRNDGRQVNNSFCDSYSRPVEPTEQFCYSDCPIDCQLFPWEPWISNTCSCGVHPNSTKELLRFRRLMTVASPRGRPCPVETVQRVACPLRPCYVTQGDQWSECRLDEGATCGYGFKSRNITCVRETDRQPVPLSYCDLHTTTWEDLYQEKPCYVNCYTECRRWRWGPWSSCDAGGVRFRKRITHRVEAPPCSQDTPAAVSWEPPYSEEELEYANCNATAEASSYEAEPEEEDEETTTDADYYASSQSRNQPEKTYLLLPGSEGRTPAEHTALAVAIAAASLAAMLALLFLTVRCRKDKSVHKV